MADDQGRDILVGLIRGMYELAEGGESALLETRTLIHRATAGTLTKAEKDAIAAKLETQIDLFRQMRENTIALLRRMGESAQGGQ